MFEAKKKSLFDSSKQKPASATSTMTVENPFLRAGLKEQSKVTPHGAVKYSTTGSDFVDQFARATDYKAPRSYAAISADMEKLWNQNKLLTLCLVFYIRMITRVVQFFNGSKTETTQRGQGLKHEGIFRMMWIAINAPDTFWKNISLFISVGSWKDIITMLSYDLQFNGWKDRVLDWNKFGLLLLAGLENTNTSELIKKYLPQIKSNSHCKTIEAQADNMIAKWICSLLFGEKDNNGSTYKKYRKLKSSGTAHEWQQLISQKQMLKINFNTIHGRALAQLVSGKFLKNNNLELRYKEWIASKPAAKYTGYVYELFTALGNSTNMSKRGLEDYQVDTMNKQFYTLVETGKKGMKEGQNGLIVVLDTSGSMTSTVTATKVSAYSVGKTLALYFSYLIEGPFKNAYLEFSDSTILKFWKGNNPVDQLCSDNSSIIAGTNFLSVADHFGQVKRQGVDETDFPTGILCVSDGCFNGYRSNRSSNVEALRAKLKSYGFSQEYCDNFKVILWDIPNGFYDKNSKSLFENFADCPNLFHISGLDGSVIAFITGVEGQKMEVKNSEELFLAAMNQEVLNMLEV